MKRKIICNIVTIIVTILCSSCCMICTSMVNRHCTYDHYVENEYIWLRMSKDHMREYSRILDSLDPEFVYTFAIYLTDSSYSQKMDDPQITIHSLSFTTSKSGGDTIPYILYLSYYIRKYKIGILDTIPQIFPIQITSEMEMGYKNSIQYVGCNRHFMLFAFLPKSADRYRKGKYRYRYKLYVNYDIEVGGKHYTANVLYRQKTELDCRPKFW